MPNDIRYALRSLTHSPAFATVAVLTLALGIGANTAMFSVLNGVLIRPLDYPNAARIVQLNTTLAGRSFPRATGPDVVDIRSEASTLQEVAFYYGGDMGVQLGERADFVTTYLVSPNFFAVFGVAPAVGRTFQVEDAGSGAIVGEAFAERNFGSAAAAMGRIIRMEGVAYAIVGVAPASFRFPRPAEAQVWLAVAPQPRSMERTAYNYRAIALVRAGVSLETANAELGAIGARLQTAFPDANRDKTFRAVPLQEQLAGPVRPTLYFLMAAVSLVLIIACANVANLLLARATARQREIAVRAALGATRRTIVRQLLVESGVIALSAGTIGFLLAVGGTRVLSQAAAQQVGLPRVSDIQIDWAVFAFAACVSVFASLLFGVSPAWHAAGVDLNDALRQGGRGVAGASGRLRHALVVAQIALSFALAIGAGLLARSFHALTSVDPGYRSEGVLVMEAHRPARTLDDYLRAARFFDGAVEKMRQVPGVLSAGAAMGVPTGRYGSNGGYVVDGADFRRDIAGHRQATFSLAGPGYFAAMGIPMRRGRDFVAGDAYDRPFVAIVSESLARQAFPEQDPIGHTIMCGLDSDEWMTIVGVVADVRQDSPASPPGPTLYMPLLQHPYHANEIQVVMRTALPAASLVEPASRMLRALDPEVAIRFSTLAAMVSESITTPRLRMALVELFAALAIVLAMAGMYGVMSYVTLQRIPEFGVRLALGASPRRLVWLVIGRAAQMAAGGAALGALLALFAARVLNTMLFGLKATDAVTYALVLLVLTPVVVLAAAIPAWRAARVDPVTALRFE